MWITIGVSIGIAVLLIGSVIRLIRQRKQGGGCAGCPHACSGTEGCAGHQNAVK